MELASRRRATSEIVGALHDVQVSVLDLADVVTQGLDALGGDLALLIGGLESISQLIANPLGTRAAEFRARGLRAFRNGWWEESRGEFTQALDADPYDAISWLTLAALDVLSDAPEPALEKALKAVRYSVENSTLDAASSISAARILVSLGRSQEADRVLSLAQERLQGFGQAPAVIMELALLRCDRRLMATAISQEPLLIIEAAERGFESIDDAARDALDLWQRANDHPDIPLDLGQMRMLCWLLQSNPIFPGRIPAGAQFASFCSSCGSWSKFFTDEHLGFLCTCREGLVFDHDRLAAVIDTVESVSGSLSRIQEDGPSVRFARTVTTLGEAAKIDWSVLTYLYRSTQHLAAFIASIRSPNFRQSPFGFKILKRHGKVDPEALRELDAWPTWADSAEKWVGLVNEFFVTPGADQPWWRTWSGSPAAYIATKQPL